MKQFREVWFPRNCACDAASALACLPCAAISSILPGRARQSRRPGKRYGEGRAPGPPGRGPLDQTAHFSCSCGSILSEHQHVRANRGDVAAKWGFAYRELCAAEKPKWARNLSGENGNLSTGYFAETRSACGASKPIQARKGGRSTVGEPRFCGSIGRIRASVLGEMGPLLPAEYSRLLGEEGHKPLDPVHAALLQARTAPALPISSTRTTRLQPSVSSAVSSGRGIRPI